jgi:hypothetical protein
VETGEAQVLLEPRIKPGGAIKREPGLDRRENDQQARKVNVALRRTGGHRSGDRLAIRCGVLGYGPTSPRLAIALCARGIDIAEPAHLAIEARTPVFIISIIIIIIIITIVVVAVDIGIASLATADLNAQTFAGNRDPRTLLPIRRRHVARIRSEQVDEIIGVHAVAKDMPGDGAQCTRRGPVLVREVARRRRPNGEPHRGPRGPVTRVAPGCAARAPVVVHLRGTMRQPALVGVVGRRVRRKGDSPTTTSTTTAITRRGTSVKTPLPDITGAVVLAMPPRATAAEGAKVARNVVDLGGSERSRDRRGAQDGTALGSELADQKVACTLWGTRGKFDIVPGECSRDGKACAAECLGHPARPVGHRH